MKGLLAVAPPLAVAILGALILAVSWFGAFFLIFGALDARGRYKDYVYLSRFNYLTERLALFYGRSFCGRWMVASVDPRWRLMYTRKGYKWWHFLPDDFPNFLFNTRFWRALFQGHRTV